jgi:hypothetical protein
MKQRIDSSQATSRTANGVIGRCQAVYKFVPYEKYESSFGQPKGGSGLQGGAQGKTI